MACQKAKNDRALRLRVQGQSLIGFLGIAAARLLNEEDIGPGLDLPLDSGERQAGPYEFPAKSRLTVYRQRRIGV